MDFAVLSAAFWEGIYNAYLYVTFYLLFKIKYSSDTKRKCSFTSKEKNCCAVGFSISVQATVRSRFLKIIELFFDDIFRSSFRRSISNGRLSVTVGIRYLGILVFGY